MPPTLAEAVFENIIARHGFPHKLNSDQRRANESIGIKMTRTTPLHPQFYGMVERHNLFITLCFGQLPRLGQICSLFKTFLKHFIKWCKIILLLCNRLVQNTFWLIELPSYTLTVHKF